MTEVTENDERGARRSRELIGVGVVFLFLSVAVAALLVSTLQRDRDALVSRVEQERLEELDNVVLLVGEDVDDVVDDLDLIARLISTHGIAGENRSALSAVVAGVPAYRAAHVRGADGRLLLDVTDPRHGPVPPQLTDAMNEVSGERPSPGARIAVSRVVEVAGGYYRVFGLRGAGDEVVVLAVDTSAWLSGLRLLSSDPSSYVLVLGPGGRIAPSTDRQIAARLPEAEQEPELRRLLAAMRAGERGSGRISGTAAARLGFGDAVAVYAYAPIRLEEGGFWSIATFGSVASLEDQEAALVERFAAAMAAVLALFAAFAAYVVATTRSTALLRQRLAHAAQLAEMNTQLLHAEKLATVGGLSAGIAHEIGTPLGVIRGRAEYVLRKVGDDHPQAASLRTIIEQIDRVSKIIRELLDYSRPRPAAGRPTELPEVIEKATDLLSGEFRRADVDMELDIPTDLPLLQADPDHLQQVLVNLLVNARDACERGGKVMIAASEVDGRVQVEVTDTGQGIPEAYIHQIFDPFFTTKKRGHGTGLGLAVVSQIVRSHGGEVEVESVEGRGTTIRLLWPSAK